MSVNVLAAHVTPTTCTEERRWVRVWGRGSHVFRCMWVDVGVCVSHIPWIWFVWVNSCWHISRTLQAMDMRLAPLDTAKIEV